MGPVRESRSGTVSGGETVARSMSFGTVIDVVTRLVFYEQYATTLLSGNSIGKPVELPVRNKLKQNLPFDISKKLAYA